MYGACAEAPLTEPYFSFSSMKTMTFFSVVGGVRGVPDALQMVPLAKGGPPLAAPSPFVPPSPSAIVPLDDPLDDPPEEDPEEEPEDDPPDDDPLDEPPEEDAEPASPAAAPGDEL